MIELGIGQRQASAIRAHRRSSYAPHIARLPCRVPVLKVIAIASLHPYYTAIMKESDEQILKNLCLDRKFLVCYIECTKTTNTPRKEEAI